MLRLLILNPIHKDRLNFYICLRSKNLTVIRKIIISVFFILFYAISFSQLSKVHYIPPLTSGPSNADPLDQWFYISTPKNGDVSFKVIPVGDPSQETSYIVNNGNPKKIQIASLGFSQLFQDPETTSTVTNNKGYIIESQDVIYVSVRMNAGGFAQAGALVSKGENALGTKFRIGTYDNKGNPGPNYMNFFSLMATEDDTTVNLTNNNQSGLVIQNYSGQFPIENIKLNNIKINFTIIEIGAVQIQNEKAVSYTHLTLPTKRIV